MSDGDMRFIVPACYHVRSVKCGISDTSDVGHFRDLYASRVSAIRSFVYNESVILTKHMLYL